MNWTINEVRWATKVSQLTHGTHFIVNTATDGRGPLLNTHPVTQAPRTFATRQAAASGRCPPPTPATGSPTPTSGPIRRTTAAAAAAGRGGRLLAIMAISLAQNADGQLGPGFQSDFY